MLRLNDLRKVAARSGARDIGNVEIDVILTHLLQLFSGRGITDHVAFKGGTMLRKMVFGPRGRLSTDLDFTLRTDVSRDDLLMMVLEAVNEPYEGLSFRLEDNDWYVTDDGCAANPVCSHADNERGVNIKLQFATSATRPIRLRPRPINDSRCLWCRRIGLPVCTILKVSTLMNAVADVGQIWPTCWISCLRSAAKQASAVGP
jgi:hypothetical protein